ncbi:helix-turn-helix domain-containing protein [Chryseobacterium rhizosphaerae]|uniref:XRE family transcriptional regulator n=1 Tax=Chryseobacterium rhizosphaerae TaxID=395937 RepID=A0ABX9IFW0_9FLAO|nr:helix-turn-helix transcriptional regulator [Chryseobacterium rhizosphaerae]MDC8099638.1 helix-turn-helix domain-containing protein [Chryseobacterium rhizosphaerae]REC72419.1 XRE family transcriptional regulator [Chryseobacterium rhizosphaerae]
MSIGAKVKKFRETRGISQDELALRLDVAQSTISSIESDKNIPSSLLLNKIAKELDVDINELLNEGIQVNISNNKFSDLSSAGTINQYNPVFNMQSPEIIENILKNQQQITKLIESQNKFIETLLKKDKDL